MDELRKEKLEEMRQDMLVEQRMRDDWIYALEVVDNKYSLQEATQVLRDSVEELQQLGYDVTEKELLDEI